MPEPVLDLALLWTPLTTVTRCPPLNSPDTRPIQFPSWSWIGWEGEITFDLTGTEDYMEKLKNRISLFAKSSQGVFFQRDKVMSRERETKDSTIANQQWVLCNYPHGTQNPRGVVLYHLYDNCRACKGYDKAIGKTVASRLAAQQLPITSHSSTILRFRAFALPGSIFLSTNLTISELKPTFLSRHYPHSQFPPSQWLYIYDNQRCGVLYGILESQADKLVKLAASTQNLYFVVLSESALAPYPQMHSILEDGEIPESDISVPLGSVLNIMLIEEKGGYAERVAIGQMNSWAWREAGPMEYLITLG